MTDPASITLQRTIAAPLEHVWQAWTDPTLMARWYCPNPALAVTAEVDLRVGGAWSVTMGTMHVAGEFLEIDEPRSLSFTWAWSHEPDTASSIVIVCLEPADAGTTLTLTHRGLTIPADRDGHLAGWTASLDRLSEALH